MKSLFGAPDRRHKQDGSADNDGQVLSEFPAWTQNNSINELDEEIGALERDLEHGMIPGELRYSARDELKTLKCRFDEIVSSRPNYDQQETQFLHGELNKLSDNIGDSLYTEYDQKKGLARPHREADLNDFPCIPIHPEIVKICNLVNFHGGKVSRNQADKARKILCDYFGRDDSSREAIRRTTGTSVGRNSVGYTNPRFAKAYDRIYGKGSLEGQLNQEIPEEKVKERIDNIKEKMNTLENTENVPQSTKPEVVKETVVSETQVVQWECPECDEHVDLKRKGVHIAAHRRQEKKDAKNKQLIEA